MPRAVNNRKRKAADSAEIFHDRPDRDDQSRREGRRERRGRGAGGKGELKKVNATVLRVIDRVSAKIR